MMGFHGCCLWALGLLLWWVSEGALDILAFVCECWFMIWLLLRVLSFKMIITARMVRKRFCLACSWEFVQGERMSCGFSVWWMCCLLMDFIGFMCSMNAVVVCEFMMRDFLVCSLWMWCGNHSVIVVSSVESCVFSWDCKNGARSWIICCAKRRGLTGNGRIDRCRHVRFFSMVSCMSVISVDVIMNAWDDSTLRSYHACTGWGFAMISCIELLMMFTACRPGIPMPGLS